MRIFHLFYVFYLGALSGHGADIVGTDLLSGAFAAGMQQASPPVTVDFAGTLPGKRAFLEGRASAVVICLRPGDTVPALRGSAPALEFHFASVAVIVAVHASNKVESLTLEQLANAFAKEARTAAQNWNDLIPSARSELITPAVYSPDGTLVLEIFQGIALAGLSYRADIRQRIPTRLAEDIVSARAGALLLMPDRPSMPARALAIADGRPGRSTTAYTADETNLYTGDYPLQLPLMLYVRPEKLVALRPALKWLLSDDAAGVLRQQGLHPAPSAIRGRLAQRLDTR